MSSPTTNSDNLFRLPSFRPNDVAFKINQLHRSIHDLQTLKANRLGVIWSSLTGN